MRPLTSVENPGERLEATGRVRNAVGISVPEAAKLADLASERSVSDKLTCPDQSLLDGLKYRVDYRKDRALPLGNGATVPRMASASAAQDGAMCSSSAGICGRGTKKLAIYMAFPARTIGSCEESKSLSEYAPRRNYWG